MEQLELFFKSAGIVFLICFFISIISIDCTNKYRRKCQLSYSITFFIISAICLFIFWLLGV